MSEEEEGGGGEEYRPTGGLEVEETVSSTATKDVCESGSVSATVVLGGCEVVTEERVEEEEEEAVS